MGSTGEVNARIAAISVGAGSVYRHVSLATQIKNVKSLGIAHEGRCPHSGFGHVWYSSIVD